MAVDPISPPQSRPEAEALDGADPLKDKRAAFDLPPGLLYFAGNSLGPPPSSATRALERAAEAWRARLVGGWNDENWIDLARETGARIAPLIGVEKDDVIVADSVSVNLFKLAGALIAERPGAVAIERGEFPTDGYIAEGLAMISDAPYLIVEPEDRPESLRVLIKSAVNYATAEIADIAAEEARAASAGYAVIWDLSHAAGVVALDLSQEGARYAVGCGYKYLNGGPGAPSYLYVARDAAARLVSPLPGWMGHAAPFDFDARYAPAPGAERFACGTPPILSLAAFSGALDVFDGVAPAALERKARALSDLFLARAAALGFEVACPVIGARRGGHVSLSRANGYEIIRALIEDRVIGDFRPPDRLRFGCSPLPLRFVDVWDACDRLADIIENERWRDPRYAVRRNVT